MSANSQRDVNSNTVSQQAMDEQFTYRYPWCAAFGAITTIIGIATVIGLYFCTCVLHCIQKHNCLLAEFAENTCLVVWAAALGSMNVDTVGLAIYLLIIAVPISLLEFAWLINKCPPVCRQDGMCCYMWRFMCWIDTWKRAMFYLLVSVPCFILATATQFFLGYLAGITLIVCGLVYFIKTWQMVVQPVYTKSALASQTVDKSTTTLVTSSTSTSVQPATEESPILRPPPTSQSH